MDDPATPSLRAPLTAGTATATAPQSQSQSRSQPPMNRPDFAAPPASGRPSAWHRTRFVLLFGGLFLFAVAADLSANPVLTPGDAFRFEASESWWLPLLFGLELCRQVHLVALEHFSGYRKFYASRIVAPLDRVLSQLDYAQRYRASRLLGWFLIVYLTLFIFARVSESTMSSAVVGLPLWLWSSIPFIARTAVVVLVVLAPVAVACWLLYRGGFHVYEPADLTVRYSDVLGQDEAISGVRDKVFQITRAEAIERRGGYVSGGLLLWGPSGTGKTMTAQAVAGETGSPLVVVDLGAFRYARSGLGQGLSRLKVASLFRRVRRLASRHGGAVVLLERIDALGSNRNGRGGDDGGDLDGTVAALSAEMSILRRPTGVVNRLRRAFGAACSPACPWTLLVMTAKSPDEVPAELLRPGRFDRGFEVPRPTRQGRARTLQGYLSQVRHSLTTAQVQRLAAASDGATGASIRQAVNDGLAFAIQAGRDSVTWSDMVRPRLGKGHGPSDGRGYGAVERHSAALHEACHAVVAYRLRRARAAGAGTAPASEVDVDAAVDAAADADADGLAAAAAVAALDVVTIECRRPAAVLGSGTQADDGAHIWNSDVEIRVMASLASLVGERLFYDGDNSSAVAQDLHTATLLVSRHLATTAFGQSLASRGALVEIGQCDTEPAGASSSSFAGLVEARLRELYERTSVVLAANRRWVLAVAHAVETHRTIAGEDVDAVLRGTVGPTVDGRRYHDPGFLAVAEAYHAEALRAHRGLPSRGLQLPGLQLPDLQLPGLQRPDPVASAAATAVPSAAPGAGD